MKKVYKIEVDCAVCAAKVEDALKKMDELNDVSINFMTQKMILDVNEEPSKDLMKKIKKTACKIEPDFEIENV